MKITDILNQSKRARTFYFNHQNMEEGELLKNLEAIFEIEKKQETSPILARILDDYQNLFKVNHFDVLKKIDGKNEREIRFDYEEFKRGMKEYKNVHYNSKDNGEDFKFKVDGSKNNLKDSFSSRGSDLIR